MKEAHPDIDVIMITGLSQIDTAVQAMKLGAFDYLPKPFDPDELKLVVQRALERRQLLQENLNLKSEVSSKYRFENIIGSSPQMQSVYRLIAKCAPTNSTVLLTGESGTGKELIARAIHYNSLRKDKPFVAVDCNSLSENLLESELFGHVKGAFTGAVANKKGMFEVADGGTLFLDEIGNISLSTQAKLLRVIQEREFRAVGDTRTQTANVRLITATNKDLKAMVAAGHVPRRSVLSHQHLSRSTSRRCASAATTSRRWPFIFSRSFSERTGEEGDRILRGRDERAGELRLAGQCARTREHRAPRGDPRHRQRHPPGAPGRTSSTRSPQLELDVPRTGDELKRVKKIAREKSVEDIEKLFVLEALKRNAWNVTRERRGDRHAARQFPGADEEVRHPDPGTRTRRRSPTAPDRLERPPARLTGEFA